MCIVCRDWEAGKLTSEEALGHLGEMMKGREKGDAGRLHYEEVVEKILDKEVPLSDSDEELDRSWHEETHDG
jgi:hypothetical protein